MYAIVADGHDMVAYGTALVVDRAYRCERIDSARDSGSLLELMQLRTPQLLVLELHMPGSPSSTELVRMVRKAAPHSRIIIQSSFDAPLSIEAGLQAGADGYVRKAQGLRELVRALRTTQRGRLFIPPGTLESVIDHPWKSLSAAEKHVLIALANGTSLRSFASASGRSYKTVSNQKYAALEKLGLSTYVEISSYFSRSGLQHLLSDFPQHV